MCIMLRGFQDFLPENMKRKIDHILVEKGQTQQVVSIQLLYLYMLKLRDIYLDIFM